MRGLMKIRVVGWGIAVCWASAAVVAAETPPVPAQQQPQEAPSAMVVGDNMDIGMEYTLTSDGVVVDSTEGRSPFHYVHGRRQIVPGLERQLSGMKVGESREIVVSPEEGYGAVDPTAFVDVPNTQLPHDIKPAIGMVLRGVNPDGTSFHATVTELKGDHVVLDLNHPLAGKTLTFKVKITGIAPAQSSR